MEQVKRNVKKVRKQKNLETEIDLLVNKLYEMENKKENK